MAKTNAERQAAYRARLPLKDNGKRRLDGWITTSAALSLVRLARHHGTTKQAMIERLIGLADDAVLADVEIESPEWARYFGHVIE